ncbi:MAG: hypothetical protein KNN13_02230 [Hydrogenobacter thermophilus]|uniref:hypothetical protein n=1 Tax=Hydrogenobacter thermophilus TaxID=940 RepID=UPI001C76EFB0|nr:hypothetical protein [Hydrogenobacter thermophilus]QWK20171.1 MAG: hypothetical protein KNN13_02230 [Hydrogenobacter thermophilus]
MRARIENIIERLEREKSYYWRCLKKGERVRKRERDTFLTEKDRNILIESFVIGGLLENFITKALNRLF